MEVFDSLAALREGDAFEELEWLDFGSCGFLNPPYSDINPWGCAALSNAQGGFTTVALLPYTPDVKWWYWVEQAQEVRRIPHRVKYLTHGGLKATTPMFPSCVVIWRPQPRLTQPYPPRYVTWDYR